MASAHQKLLQLGITPSRSSTTIDDLERQLGVRIPEDLRDTLACGGGTFTRPVFYLDNGVPVQVGWLMTCDEALQAYDDLSGSIEAQLLPFADDGGDNMLCVSLHGPNRGRIYFHDHGVGTEDSHGAEPTSAYLVAESFSALVASMFSEE